MAQHWIPAASPPHFAPFYYHVLLCFDPTGFAFTIFHHGHQWAMVCSFESMPPLPKYARSTWDLLAAEVESIHDDSIIGAKKSWTIARGKSWFDKLRLDPCWGLIINVLVSDVSNWTLVTISFSFVATILWGVLPIPFQSQNPPKSWKHQKVLASNNYRRLAEKAILCETAEILHTLEFAGIYIYVIWL
jgi:hypothetical protein